MASYADEKGDVAAIERMESKISSSDAAINRFTPEEQKNIIRKVDLRLIPTLGFMYCVSLMDRTNLGVAMVAGMGVDLKLTSERYSTVVLLFFITYVALQPPATVVLRKLGPKLFLPSIVVIWGAVMIAFAFVKEWTTLIPLRLLLGIFEAGFFPGMFETTARKTWALTNNRLRIPPFVLVQAIRAPEAQYLLLPHRNAVIRLFGYPGLPLLTAQRLRLPSSRVARSALEPHQECPQYPRWLRSRLVRLEMDFHAAGHNHCRHRPRRMVLHCRFPRASC